MTRSTTIRWTTGMAAVALLALPPVARAQAPTQAPTTPAAQSATQPSQQATTPQDHIRQAEEALNSISPTAVTGPTKARIAELKRHVNALQRAAGANDTASATGAAKRSERATQARGNVQWATEAAAADRILTELLGPAGATGASGATGTAGATPPKGPAAITIDEDTRAKLTEVRTHLTAFAAGMSGSGSTPDTTSATAPTSATSSAAGSAAAPTQPPTSATQPPTGSEPPAATQPPSAAQPSSATQPPASAAQTPTAGASAQPPIDKEAAKRALTAARDSLSQLTQLPAASQLTGDTRMQISQLITNFNELITTDAEWRATYAKVDANLTALIGAQTTDESTATPTSGTAGAVGTSGTAAGSLDPAIRAKLVEFRTHLNEFYKAAGGVAASGAPSAPPSGAAMTSGSSPTSTMGSAASGTGSSTGATSSTTGAAGSATAGATGTTGTAGSTAATAPASAAADQSNTQSEALRHIAAIEAILNGNASSGAAAGTSGTATATGSTSAAAGSSLTLTSAQIEELRSHLNELKRLVGQSK